MTKQILYQLYCEICNWKMITDGTDVDSLYEHKTANIPGGIPKLDTEKKEVVSPKSLKQHRKFRCKKCGRVVIPRKLPENMQQLKINELNEKSDRDKYKEEWDEADRKSKEEYERKRKEYEQQQDRIGRS